MANIINQIVTQINIKLTSKRLAVQYTDSVTEEDKQQIVNYEDLTTEEKATFDAYQALCQSKMV